MGKRLTISSPLPSLAASVLITSARWSGMSRKPMYKWPKVHALLAQYMTWMRVDPDANSLPCSAAEPVDPVSKVLDDDNLLIEIIVRLGFPTTLVCAALVCKRWYCHASDPAFLRRFRKLHPPHLLRFYVNTGEELNPASFVPMLPQPPEFDSVFRHTSFSVGPYENGCPWVTDCWKNSVITHFVGCDGARGSVHVVHNPLFPKRGMAIAPPSPCHHLLDGSDKGVGHLVIKGGDNLSYFYVFVETTNEGTESTMHVYMFQDGVWCMVNSVTAELSYEELHQQKPLPVNNKIYILASRCAIVFDVRALSFSIILLPQGVVCGNHFFTINSLGLECGGRTMLSRADDDLGVYLIHVNELQLFIWLHEGDNWLLVDTIYLHEMCADLRISDCRPENENNGFVVITMVGPNAEFVLLETPLCILYWDIKCRTLRKVHDIRRYDRLSRCVHPFMMIWPPTFPALKDSPARDGGEDQESLR